MVRFSGGGGRRHVSRTERSKRYRGWYSTESPYAKFLTRRRNRRAGKRLMEDAPPDKGTQGWMTH